ncbi:MAG: HDOD domain-containing protein [Spirochaetota bacterium]
MDRNPDIVELLDQVDASEIASIKRVVSGILRIINDPEATIEDLKSLIDVDPPLAAEVLKTANSAYYTSGRRIDEIEQAVIWIGFEEVKEIVLRQSVRPVFSSRTLMGSYSRPLLWKHCVSVASLGKMIFRKEFAVRGESMYAVGLLHDIGIIIEDQFRNQQFVQVLALVEESMDLVQAERQVLGYDHARVGEALASRWLFPEEFERSIGCHHDTFQAPQERSRMELTLCLANLLVNRAGLGYSGRYGEDEQVGTVMDTLGLEREAVDLIMEELKVRISALEKQGLV